MSIRRLGVPAVPLALTAVAVALAVAGGSPRDVQAQVGVADWRTIAGGDEILSLAVDPTDVYSLWAGTEGGGVVVWDLARGTYEQHVFPTQEGLQSNDVRDIAFDSRGTAWLATPSGVVHADGDVWRTYGTDDGLPSNDVLAVAVGGDGEIWVGTYSEGVAVKPADEDRFEPIDSVEFVQDEDGVVKDGPGSWHVMDIAVSPDDGRVWLAHGREEMARPALSVYDPSDGSWYHISAALPGSEGGGLPTDQILSLAFDDGGRLWTGTWSEGVVIYDVTDGSWTQYTDVDGVCGLNVWDLAIEGQDVWVACDEDGLAASHWDGGEWTVWGQYDEDDEPTGIPSDGVRAVAVADGVGYLGTNGLDDSGYGPDGVGYGIVPIEGDAVGEIMSTAPDLPPYNDVTALAFDPATGDLWVGTRESGLMRFDGSRWDTFTRESTDELLVGDTVTDLLVFDDQLWVATTKDQLDAGEYIDGGVSIYDLRAADWLDPLRSDNSDLPDDDVSSLAVDGDGRVWIGMGQTTGGVGESFNAGNGVAVYDPRVEAFDEFFVYDGPGVELPGDTVQSIDARGQEVWVGASYAFVGDRREGGGAGQYDGGAWTDWGGGDDGFKTYHGSGDPQDVDPFITGDVRAVKMARDGTVYAGTWDLDTGSLGSVWPFVDAVVNRWDGTEWLNDAFAGDGWVSSIAEDGDGRIWAATTRGHQEQEVELLTRRRSDTAAGGVYLWDGRDWAQLTPRSSGLASSAVADIAVDPTTGYVWFALPNGGLSVYESGEPVPTETPCENCPTHTPRPTSEQPGPTVPPVYTNQAPGPVTPVPGAPTATASPPPVPTVNPDEPQPPPEVPEPGTLLLVGAGLAAIVGYLFLRRRRADTGALGQ